MRASATPTSSLPETILTPSTPLATQTAYRLVKWTPERADDLIAVLETYPETTDAPFPFAIQEAIYWGAFQYAALVEREAQLRFPTDSRVTKWRLGEAAHTAYSSHLVGGDLYRQLFLDALNAGEVSFNDVSLTNWFNSYPTDIRLDVDELPPPTGYISSHIVSISQSGIGGTTFWLLQRKEGYTSYPLFNGLGDSSATDYTWRYADLTNDGKDDITIFQGDHNGTFIGGELAIFDLAQAPPRKLSLGPEPAWLVAGGWAQSIDIKQGESGINQLEVWGGTQLSSCSLDFTNTFEWNGQWFDLVEVGINYRGDKFRYSCIHVLDELSYLSVVERRALLQFYEATFGDAKPTGVSYPPDARDEFRYRLAIHHALLGQRPEAIAYLHKIINTPTIKDSSWITPAQDFLASYQTTEDTFVVCQQAKVECDLHHALEQTAEAIPPADFDVAIERLKDHGVPVLGKGFFYVGNESTQEQWFTVRNPLSGQIELWVLAQAERHLKALFVNTVTLSTPNLKTYLSAGWGSDYSFLGSDEALTIFDIGTTDLYVLIRRLRGQEPFIVRLESREPEPAPQATAASLQGQAIDELLGGKEPTQIVTQLLSIRELPDFKPNSEFDYYLGLAYELAGDEENAVGAYLQAWQSCCYTWGSPEYSPLISDPYAIMARAKLELNP